MSAESLLRPSVTGEAGREWSAGSAPAIRLARRYGLARYGRASSAVHPNPASSRNDGLDLLRVVGAALVFATHLYHSYGQTWLGPIAYGGNVGVMIFFPLSGYLLYRPFAQGEVDLRRYAISRAARIFPAYYLAAIVIALTISPVVASVPVFTFTTNIFTTPHADHFGQSWTLGVELTFYALLPLLARARRGLTVMLLAGLAYWSMLNGDEWWWGQFPALFWSFAAGMLVARYEDRIRTRKVWLLGVPLVAYGVLVVSPIWTTLGTAALILWSVKTRPSMPWARFPANISYGIYLWHPFGIFVLLSVGLTGPLLVIASVALVSAIAVASWVLLERPVMRWATGLRQHQPIGHARRERQVSWRARLGRPNKQGSIAGP